METGWRIVTPAGIKVQKGTTTTTEKYQPPKMEPKN